MSQPPQVPYQQQFNVLADEHHANGDPSVFVFDMYLRWKGVPLNGARLTIAHEHLSRHFSVLEYPGTNDFRVFCTLGASRSIIPGSVESFAEKRGIRYEYLMHSHPAHQDTIIELLLHVAEFPFNETTEVQPGYVLHMGGPLIPNSGIEYLYYTYPFVDDNKIYSDEPWTQIERGVALIQILWLIPIYKSEYQFLRRHGPEMFEELLNQRHRAHYDAYDLMRMPYC